MLVAAALSTSFSLQPSGVRTQSSLSSEEGRIQLQTKTISCDCRTHVVLAENVPLKSGLLKLLACTGSERGSVCLLALTYRKSFVSSKTEFSSGAVILAASKSPNAGHRRSSDKPETLNLGALVLDVKTDPTIFLLHNNEATEATLTLKFKRLEDANTVWRWATLVRCGLRDELSCAEDRALVARLGSDGVMFAHQSDADAARAWAIAPLPGGGGMSPAAVLVSAPAEGADSASYDRFAIIQKNIYVKITSASRGEVYANTNRVWAWVRQKSVGLSPCAPPFPAYMRPAGVSLVTLAENAASAVIQGSYLAEQLHYNDPNKFFRGDESPPLTSFLTALAPQFDSVAAHFLIAEGPDIFASLLSPIPPPGTAHTSLISVTDSIISSMSAWFETFPPAFLWFVKSTALRLCELAPDQCPGRTDTLPLPPVTPPTVVFTKQADGKEIESRPEISRLWSLYFNFFHLRGFNPSFNRLVDLSIAFAVRTGVILEMVVAGGAVKTIDEAVRADVVTRIPEWLQKLADAMNNAIAKAPSRPSQPSIFGGDRAGLAAAKRSELHNGGHSSYCNYN